MKFLVGKKFGSLLSEFTHETGETSSYVIVGFTPGYYWLLIFENKQRRGSLLF